MSQSSPAPDPVAWMVRYTYLGSPHRKLFLHKSLALRLVRESGGELTPLFDQPSALPATTPSATPQEIAALESILRAAEDERVKTGRWSYFTLGGWGGDRLICLLNRLKSARVSPSESSATDTTDETARVAVRALRDAAYQEGCSAGNNPFTVEEATKAEQALLALLVPPSAPDTKPDERLAEIRERLAGISPTPWEHVGYFNAMRHIAGCGQTDDNVPHYIVRREGSYLKPNGARADAEFIAHAPEDIAYLLRRSSSSPPEGEDTQRMDWLEERTKAAPGQYSGLAIAILSDDSFAVGEAASVGFNGWADGEGPTLRDAIDSARAAIPPQENR